MATVTIHVTESDIKHGVARSACLCPVGRALMRETGKVWEVTGSKAIVGGERVPLPDDVVKWITAFDNNRSCGAFEFQVEVPDA